LNRWLSRRFGKAADYLSCTQESGNSSFMGVFPDMARQSCRFGILGTANIARKNWDAIRNSGSATLVAVGSRNRQRAEQFISECQASAPFAQPPQAMDYEQLIASRDIDAIYIPLPTGIRKQWVLRAAAAGKHVLCEKPCGCSAAELAEILETCRASGVQFMDGVMFMHSSRLASIRQTLDDGASVGDIRRIMSQFSFLGSEDFFLKNIRTSHELEPLGCLGDLGWYNIRFSLWSMKYQLPIQASGRFLTAAGHGKGGHVPIEFAGELIFDGGRSAGFYCSFNAENQQWAIISGTKGALHVQDFVLPFYGSEATYTVSQPHFEVRGCQFNMQGREQQYSIPEYSNNAPDSQETALFRRFAELVLSGRPDPIWGEIALKTQKVVDACLKSAQQDGALVPV
jgi:predicted dehydrogenase